nr:MAG TPA_asm: hypothetical protein [Caudoviricetes sp.]
MLDKLLLVSNRTFTILFFQLADRHTPKSLNCNSTC